ncbi:hypothetical protein D3C71_2192660 [compost metagenome]
MLSAAMKPPVAAMPALLMISVASLASAAAAATSSALVTSSLTGSTPASVMEHVSRAAA